MKYYENNIYPIALVLSRDVESVNKEYYDACTGKYIVVAQSYGKDPEQCCSLMSIPKGCIKELKDLEEL
jgi:hypothetical protein